MPNRQTQNPQNEGLRNPGTFSPDDDEAQEADGTAASDMSEGRKDRKRQAQQDQPEEIADGAADEDADLEDEDDDEEDGSGARV